MDLKRTSNFFLTIIIVSHTEFLMMKFMINNNILFIKSRRCRRSANHKYHK